MPGRGSTRCSYSGCERADGSSRFFQIKEGSSAGGQDWSSVAGEVLCKACYERFRTSGSLERSYNKPLDASARRCTYKHCHSPTHGSNFYKIEEGKSAGRQDWSSVVGEVLCRACYCRFKDRGTLERSRNKPLDASARRCTHKHCDSPTESSNFYKIEQGKSARGQDWSSVVGEVLCKACYERFSYKGSLERSHNKPLDASARRCTYKHCGSPTHGSKFLQIEEGKCTGGQDWSSVVGEVLCQACYKRFWKRGTLAKDIAHVRKKYKTPAHKSSAPSKQAQPHAPSSKHKEEEQDEDESEDEDEEAPDTGECMVCLDDSRSMCIVPCGHFGLCPSCGDEGLFAGKKRPYSTCPICCEEMCEPYVMERWVWEELGGTTYDS
jgi:predicted NAD-dependent protein-ADP-ribosyltransferase YbiA (DUF1768 family)